MRGKRSGMENSVKNKIFHTQDLCLRTNLRCAKSSARMENKMKFVILTGMSGAGKSTAIKMMEDIGFYCVDNLPIPLLEKFVELTTLQSAELQKVAVGIDIRSGQSFDELHSVLDRMKENGVEYEILFLDAENYNCMKSFT